MAATPRCCSTRSTWWSATTPGAWNRRSRSCGRSTPRWASPSSSRGRGRHRPRLRGTARADLVRGRRRARGRGPSPPMIYLYAITEPLDGAAGVTGLAGARVELLSTGGVSGAYSAHEELELTADPDLLWAHEGVVEALMARATVLPLRFGTTLAD